MTTWQTVALAALGVGIGAAAAYYFFGGTPSRTVARMPNPASSGGVSVGYTTPSSGTRDWWHDRNERRRRKHLKMMTAKG